MHPFWQLVLSNAVLALLTAVGVALLGRLWKNPAALHLLWVLVLLKLVTPPLLCVPIGLTSATPEVPTVPEPTGSASSVTSTAPPSPAHATTVASPNLPAVSGAVRQNGSPSRPLGDHRPTLRTPPRWSLTTVLGGTWVLGVVALLIVRGRRIVRFRRVVQAAPAAPDAVLRRAEAVAQRLGVRRVPRVAVVPWHLSPMVWSCGGRPSVLLPSGLLEHLDAEALELILAHELAHVRRKDHWVRLVELVVTTGFWWHPVVWWACRRLHELEEECCDGLVVGLRPELAKRYTLALLDTLDFLSTRPLATPWGATAATSAGSLTRRIQMLRTGRLRTHLSYRVLLFVASVALVPLALTFAAETPSAPAAKEAPADKEATPHKRPAVERRVVNKTVKDFPEKVDLSTPESAAVAWLRASARMNIAAVAEVTWWTLGPEERKDWERILKQNPQEIASYNQAQLDAEILEVLSYRGDLAMVVGHLKFPEGTGGNPYSARYLGRINGVWKSLGEDRVSSLEATRQKIEPNAEEHYQLFARVRDLVQQGKPVSPREVKGVGQRDQLPPAVAAERAELMGRVEDFFLHNYRDVTARKSLEWGPVEKDAEGNRSIRYQYEARIWDRETQIDNKIFTFDAQGDFVSVKDVEGFPQKKLVKSKDVSSQAGLQELVEKYFRENFHDITRRETLEWGPRTPADNGNVSIRYKYRARIWDRETKILNQIFTFDAQGEVVSDITFVEGFPQDEPERPGDVNSQTGLQNLVEDFFDHNYRDIKVRETLEWGPRTPADNGNVSIRCKYRARIWDGEPQLFDKIFTFDAQGGFVSVEDAPAAPKP